MYKKSFVSISISTTKLKVVRVTPDGKRVTHAHTYDIPAGLIEQGKVQKADEFAALIKTSWKKDHLREKTVGLVLPEFATFMKTLTLPHLSLHELDEAVRWQAREFLPHEGHEMILDWKIIGETKDSYEILLVAIETEVLSGFVGAVDAAGLLPVFVETTSLCLERLAESKDPGRLVLYRSHGTIVVTIISGKKILATSVLVSRDDTVLVANIFQILARFGKDQITSIALCGNGLSSEFINALHVKSGLPVELLKLTVGGLSEAQVQDYIISLSQQSVDPEEPANTRTINLLPPAWVTHYKNQLRDLRLWTFTLVISIVVWSALLSNLAAYVYLSQRAQSVTPQSSTSDKTGLQTTITDITKINALSTRVNSIAKTRIYPQMLINLVTAVKKEGITLTAYEVNIESGKIALAGKSASRENLLAFKTALEGVKEFTKVTLPLANLLTEKDISFSIQVDYKRQ